MKFTILALVGLAILATFVLLRVVLPGLINLHNDGALILVPLLVLGAIVGWAYIIILLCKGDYR